VLVLAPIIFFGRVLYMHRGEREREAQRAREELESKKEFRRCRWRAVEVQRGRL
jgi:hypothetical protein